MTFETMIPPRSQTVLEITGEQAADFQSSEANYLLIQPDCEYTVAKNFDGVDGKFDTILILIISGGVKLFSTCLELTS